MAQIEQIINIKVIEGDAKDRIASLEAQLKQNKDELSQLNKAYKKGEVSLDEYAKSSVKLKNENKQLSQEQRQLTKEATSTANSYNALSAKMARLKKEQKDVNISTKEGRKEFDRYAKEINDTNNQLKDLDEKNGVYTRNVGNYKNSIVDAAGELNIMGTNVGALTSRVRASATAFQASSKAIGVFKAALITSGVGAILVAVGAMVKLIGNYRDFEQANANLAAVTGKTRTEIRALTEDAKRLGSQTAFTATEVSKLQVEFAKLGFNEQEIINATEATLQLAAATGSDLTQAAEVAGATVRGLGLDTSETQRVVDVMAKSFSSSALDLQKFQVAMRQVAPVAANAGLSIERTTAALGLLSDRGVRAETAGTGLRNVLLEVSKRGTTLEAILADVNNATDSSRRSMELFGKENAVVGTILAQNQEALGDLDKQLQAAGGSAERMARTQLNTLDGSITLLTSAWQGFLLSIEDGSGIIGTTLRKAIQGVTSVIQFFTKETDKGEKTLESMNSAFNRQIALLESSTLSEEARRKVIGEINKEYSDYLPSLITEKDSLQDIRDAAKEVNREFVKKITLQAQQERLTEKINAISNAQIDMVNAEIRLEEIRQEKITATQAELAELNREEMGLQVVMAVSQNTLDENNEELDKLFKARKKINNQLGYSSDNTSENTEENNKNAKSVRNKADAINEAAALEQEQQAAINEGIEETVQGLEAQERKQSNIARLWQRINNRLQGNIDKTKENNEVTNEGLTEQISNREKIEGSLVAAQQLIGSTAAIFEAAQQRQLKAAEGNEEKQAQIREKFAKKQKALAISQAIINGALAITTVTSQTGVASPAIIPLIVASTAAQVATIAAQPIRAEKGLLLDEFANGGIADNGGVLKGKRHKDGGIPFAVGGRVGFEAEGGEAIINRRSTAMFKPVLSAINQAGGGRSFQQGGQLPSNTINNITNEFNNNQLKDAFKQIKVVLPVPTNITAQNEFNTLKANNTFA